MSRPQKYGLPTTGIKVPIELKETIMSICLKYGKLDINNRKKFIDKLNEETRKDFEKRKCELGRTSKSCEVANTLNCDECPRFV